MSACTTAADSNGWAWAPEASHPPGTAPAPSTAEPSIANAIAGLAERLLTCDHDGFELVLDEGLREIGQALQLDWAILWRDPRDRETRSTWEWQRRAAVAPGGPAAPAGRPFTAALLELETERWIRLDDVRDPDVRAALLDRDVCVGAVASVPRRARAGGAPSVLVVGAASPADVDPAEVLGHLRLAAAVFGNGLARLDQWLAESGRAPSAHQSQSTPVSAAGAATAEVPPPARRFAIVDRSPEAFPAAASSGAIVGRSPAIRAVLEQIRQVARTDSTVLLLGDTGTGKELLATEIHALSARHGRPMVRVNCAAIPGTLIESELFGREKGAFTGALSRQIGRFETADRSTIFLDEIGDLPPDVQVKLLRVLEDRRIERLGSPRSVPVDVRIVAATHRDLEQRIAQETFREDLFYRLNVFPVRVPSLRERAEDIPLLVTHFVAEFSRAFGKRIDAIAPQSMAALQGYPWPGNIRELRNVVERAMIVASGPSLVIPLPDCAMAVGTVRVRLHEVEREHIRGVLERVRWRIRGTGGAADQLGLRPTTLETRMAKLGLVRPKAM